MLLLYKHYLKKSPQKEYHQPNNKISNLPLGAFSLSANGTTNNSNFGKLTASVTFSFFLKRDTFN